MNFGNLIGNVNLFQITNTSNDKLKGYECVYKESAIYNDNKIIDKKLDLRNHSPMGHSSAQFHCESKSFFLNLQLSYNSFFAYAYFLCKYKIKYIKVHNYFG